MRALVACEFSQIVTKAFREKGHDAFSCDLLPTEGNPDWHIQDDVLKHLDENWDMLIAFPPCTYLCNSGVRWLHTVSGRFDAMILASEFFYKIWNSGIEKICIENPIPHKQAMLPAYSQIIQPWMFGHSESKATCLWLKGLPPLIPTKYADFKKYRCKCGNVFETDLGKYGCCDTPAKPLWDNMTKSGQNKLAPSDHRAKDRSRTYQGIANAMSEQWNF